MALEKRILFLSLLFMVSFASSEAGTFEKINGKDLSFAPSLSSASPVSTVTVGEKLLNQFSLINVYKGDGSTRGEFRVERPAVGPNAGNGWKNCIKIDVEYAPAIEENRIFSATLTAQYKAATCNACGENKNAYQLRWFPAPGKDYILLTVPIKCQVDYLIKFNGAMNDAQIAKRASSLDLRAWPALKGKKYAAQHYGKSPFKARETIELPESVNTQARLKAQLNTLGQLFKLPKVG